jgi:uncharacterized glyoxalase superfamily protein PhnB
VAKSSMLSVALGYRDVAAASDWLCTAFGFQKHFVATSETGVVQFAQLTFGSAMLTLVSVQDSSLNRYLKQPDEIGGAETQSCYLLVSDADAHCARARSSGAEIILDIQDDDFGGRGYACRDPEGHIWNFGTYDPWQGKHPGNLPAQSAVTDRRGMWRWIVVFGMLATIVTSLVVARSTDIAFGPRQRTTETVAKEAEERAAQERLNAESNARKDAEHAQRVALEQLGRERMAKETAERAAEQAGKRLEEEQRARSAAENLVREVRQELDRMRATHDLQQNEQLDRVRQAKEIAERNAEQARQRTTEEQNAKEAAERTAQEMREQLDHVREAKELAEHNAEQATQRVREQSSAKEAAERAANELREQLGRERSAKNAALRAAAQLRRQLSQGQSAQQP